MKHERKRKQNKSLLIDKVGGFEAINYLCYQLMTYSLTSSKAVDVTGRLGFVAAYLSW